MTRGTAALLQMPVHRTELPDLLPSQIELYSRLLTSATAVPVTAYSYMQGMGATTLLKRLAQDLDARFINVRSVTEEVRNYPPLMRLEAVYMMIKTGLEQRGTVVIDDFRDIGNLTSQRPKEIIFDRLSDYAIQNGYHLVLSGVLADHLDMATQAFGSGAAVISGTHMFAEDYKTLFERELGIDAVAKVDFKQLLRGMPTIDLHQLNMLANLLKVRAQKGEAITTELVEHLLEAKIIRSNLRLREVEELTFDTLPGTEHIAQALETHIVLPFRNKPLASELDLKPRRGVLLYGPPGTGKTSIGRALAHRIQGRFFLIDGSFITEPPSRFFGQIETVISQAKKNAPSVLFIDDADVLFQIPHVAGLARYLLSLLDGIESESASNVCVMMTAMDAKKIPEALLRSGRVELWLETRAPDEATRAAIIERWVAGDMPEPDSIDFAALAHESAGFTPADLRRLAADAKLLYAADIDRGRKTASANDYLIRAINELVATRAIMADRLHDDSLRIRPYV